MYEYYVPARGRARFVAGAFAAWLLVTVLAIIALYGRITLVNNVLNQVTVSPADLNGSDSFVRISSWLTIAAYLLTAIAFLVWLSRIVKNNFDLGNLGARFSPGFAVGCWFIPFANFVLPYQAVREAWKAADPSIVRATPDTRAASRMSVLIPAWWALFLLGNVGGYIAALTVNGGGDPLTVIENLRQAAGVSIAADVVRIIAGVLMVALVLALTSRQEQRASLVAQRINAAATGDQGASTQPPPPPAP